MKPGMVSSLCAAMLCTVAVHDTADAADSVSAAAARGRTFHVAGNGVDSASCGSTTNRCRSISQAIQNAAAGDTVSVGPGRYGDLNDDQDFDDPGDEHLTRFGELACCIVYLNKPLTLVSTDGAERTIIQNASSNPVFMSYVVLIDAPNVTFGQPGHGFTVRFGHYIGVSANSTTNTRVAGNIALENFDFGFSLHGSGIFLENKVLGSNIGTTVSGTWFASNNTAMGNTYGGFGFGGESMEIRGNVAINNGFGFNIGGERAIVENNIATGNFSSSDPELGYGFNLSARQLKFARNSSIGNRNHGVRVTPDIGTSTVIRQNNIYGNDSATNCGLVNSTGITVVATQNYWGAPGGPGSDPADNAGPGSGCEPSGNTIVAPFARQPFVFQ